MFGGSFFYLIRWVKDVRVDVNPEMGVGGNGTAKKIENPGSGAASGRGEFPEGGVKRLKKEHGGKRRGRFPP